MSVLAWSDLRVLGALRLRDGVAGRPIDEVMEVVADGLVIRRNRSGLHVIASAAGFEGFPSSFERQPDDPRPLVEDAFTVRVADPARAWLPRLQRVVLPRDADPANRAQPDSLFRPIDVELLPAPIGGIASPWWAVLRVHLRGASGPLRGAWLRVRRGGPGPIPADAPVLGRAMSDARGEALLCIPALPAVTFAGGEDDDGDATADTPVTTPDTAARIEAVWDPAAPWPLDPDLLADVVLPAADGRLRATRDLALRAGQRGRLDLTLA